MLTDRIHSLILPTTVAVILLLASYVGAYYVMVHPETYDPGLPRYPFYATRLEGRRLTRYMETSRPFFAPVHWLDRRLRPHVWEPPRWRP
jgi:hypothetical protein